MKQLTSMGMRAHLYANPRKLRDLPMGMEDAYAFFPGYNGFPGQQFPGYFGPQQPIGYPPSKSLKINSVSRIALYEYCLNEC